MANIVFNIAKGRVAELCRNVDVGSPANSAIILVALFTTGLESDATLQDYDDLATLLAGASNEATNTNYARKTLTAASVTITTDDTANTQYIALADQTWTAVGAAAGAWSKLLVCYDADTTGGTDSNIIPLTAHDFVVTPDGNDIVADFGTSFYTAS